MDRNIPTLELYQYSKNGTEEYTNHKIEIKNTQGQT
jgi:hypothetical protein